MGNLELLLGLSRCFLSLRQKLELLKKLDNLQGLTVLSIEDIRELTGISPKRPIWQPEGLRQRVEYDLDMLERYSIGVVSFNSALYPPVLREIHDPPFSVYFRGTLPEPDKPLAGIVGTRSPSGDGSLAAARFGAEFARAGYGVVSGLARGIDAFAHRGNVESGGRSVAVLACGVERIYPRSNARLAGKMLERGGCLLSEYPPGEEPLKFRFPQRNRLISGLARSLLVVEAPEKSGALITADFALEQGRDVFVFTGTLNSKRGAGSAALREQGAESVDSAFEIIASWQPGHRANAVGYGISGGAQLSLDLRDSAKHVAAYGMGYVPA